MTAIGRWIGTPWMAGQNCPGRGVDCVHFVTSVLDELLGYADRDDIPLLPQDLSLHSASKAIAAVHALLRRYPGVTQLNDVQAYHPGDVIVVRREPNAGPGHVGIVGHPSDRYWHAVTGSGVAPSGMGTIKYLFKAYRFPEASEWLQPSHSR